MIRKQGWLLLIKQSALVIKNANITTKALGNKFQGLFIFSFIIFLQINQPWYEINQVLIHLKKYIKQTDMWLGFSLSYLYFYG